MVFLLSHPYLCPMASKLAWHITAACSRSGRASAEKSAPFQSVNESVTAIWVERSEPGSTLLSAVPVWGIAKDIAVQK